MDKKYLVIFIIISLVMLCKEKKKESFSETALNLTTEDKDVIKNFLDYDINDIQPGVIVSFTGSTIPVGWVLCDGTQTWVNKDGVTKKTPDLRGRFLLGAGQGSGLTKRDLGKSGGKEKITLEVKNIPAHKHTGETENDGSHSHNYSGPGSKNGSTAIWNDDDWFYSGTSSGSTSSDGAHSHGFTTDETGGGEEFDIMPPYFVVKYIIKSKV